jgi:NAD(P)-dependent dehydrogenase (short-subunit alcohol dehydrogenase family)
MSQDLRDRTVVVTGGTGALGGAVVERLLREGALPVVTSRSDGEPRGAGPRGGVRTRRLDLADERAVGDFFAEFPDLWASIHLAGGFAMAPVEQTSADDFRQMFETNAVTCFTCCREAVRHLRARGGGGRVVNVAARPAVVPTGGMVAYSASKAAVASVTQSLAEEVKAAGILINAVLPSIMDTPANRAAMPGADFAAWPKVEQVAETICFLASPANALTSGALVPVYGAA